MIQDSKSTNTHELVLLVTGAGRGRLATDHPHCCSAAGCCRPDSVATATRSTAAHRPQQ